MYISASRVPAPFLLLAGDCVLILDIQLEPSTAEANGNGVTHTLQCEWKRSALTMFVCIYGIIRISLMIIGVNIHLVSVLDVLNVINHTNL